MRRWFGLIVFITAVLAAAGGFVTAQYSVDIALAQQSPFEELKDAGSGYTGDKAVAPTDLRHLLFSVVKMSLSLVGTILIVVVLYAGYLWWSAMGNDEKTKKAKSTLRNAVIGLLIITMSYTLVLFVANSVFNIAE